MLWPAVFVIVTVAAMAASARLFPFPLFFYGLFVLGMRHAVRAAGVRAPYVTCAYVLVGAFSVFELAWHALRGRVLPPMQGLALFPVFSVACGLCAVLLLGRAVARRRFSLWFFLDILIFFNMLGPALAVLYRNTDLGCGGISASALMFSRYETGHHFGTAFSPDGNTLYYTWRNPESHLGVCRLQQGTCDMQAMPQGEAYRLITDPGRAQLLAFMYPDPESAPPAEASQGGGFYYRYDIGAQGTLAGRKRVPIPAAFPVDAALNHDGSRLAVVDKYGALFILDPDSGHVLGKRDFPGTTLYRVAWNSAGDGLYVSSPAGRVFELDAVARPTGRVVSYTLSAAGVAVAPGGGFLYVARPFLSRVLVYDTGSMAFQKSLRTRYLVREAAATPARLLAGSYRSGRVDIFDPGSGARLQQLRFGKMMRQLAVSEDGRRAAAVSYCGVFAFDLK